MMAVQFVNPNPTIDLSELPDITETYKIHWTIPNWTDIRKNEILLKNQTIMFETELKSSSLPNVSTTKWSVGFSTVFNTHCHVRYAHVHWTLLDIMGKSIDKLPQVTAQTQLLDCNGLAKFTDIKTVTNLGVGQSIHERQYCVEVLHAYGCTNNFDYVRADGSIKYVLKLMLKSCLTDEEYTCYKMKQFREKSNKKMCENLASLLIDRDISSDLKILSSDNTEIFVHRAILKAQCPVFAGMLNSDLSETNTGVVKINDVSASTMKILLTYFYTGELIPSWSEVGTIVEFTYAAGKYQITQILDLLDDMVGRSVPEGDATNIDVQLLNLISKLSKTKAEQRLLKRIVYKIENAKSSQDIFDLFGYDRDEVLEKANVLAVEKFGETKALEIVDDLLGETEQRHDDLEKRGLNLLAVVLMKTGSLKNLEIRLLTWFAKKASKCLSADELFAVFGHGKGLK